MHDLEHDNEHDNEYEYEYEHRHMQFFLTFPSVPPSDFVLVRGNQPEKFLIETSSTGVPSEQYFPLSFGCRLSVGIARRGHRLRTRRA